MAKVYVLVRAAKPSVWPPVDGGSQTEYANVGVYCSREAAEAAILIQPTSEAYEFSWDIEEHDLTP